MLYFLGEITAFHMKGRRRNACGSAKQFKSLAVVGFYGEKRAFESHGPIFIKFISGHHKRLASPITAVVN